MFEMPGKEGMRTCRRQTLSMINNSGQIMGRRQPREKPFSYTHPNRR
jgi:hypothetical protein